VTVTLAERPAVPSYASGTSDVPLLGDTIGDNLDRTATAQPDVEALVEVPTGRRGRMRSCGRTSTSWRWA
jgi:fatty-acyl-CoA synthase